MLPKPDLLDPGDASALWEERHYSGPDRLRMAHPAVNQPEQNSYVASPQHADFGWDAE